MKAVMVLHITAPTVWVWENQTQHIPGPKTLPPQKGRNSAATITAFVFYLLALSFLSLLLTFCCAYSPRPASGPFCRVDSFNTTTMAARCHGKSKLILKVKEVNKRKGKLREMAILSQRSQ